jgi:hypothetical protein
MGKWLGFRVAAPTRKPTLTLLLFGSYLLCTTFKELPPLRCCSTLSLTPILLTMTNPYETDPDESLQPTYMRMCLCTVDTARKLMISAMISSMSTLRQLTPCD